MGRAIMTKVQICVDLTEQDYRKYEREAERRGVTVESLLEQTIRALLEEVHQEEAEGTDHPIFPA